MPSRALIEKEDVYLCEFQGRRYDCGSILGYMKANVEYALRHEAIGAEFGSYLDGPGEGSAITPGDGIEFRPLLCD